MSDQKTATGRPSDPLPLIPRLLLIAVLLVGALELSLRAFAPTGALGSPSPGGSMLRVVLAPFWARYLPLRAWVVAHPAIAVVIILFVFGVMVVVVRYWLLFWHNEVKARLTGTFFSPEIS